MLIKKIPTFDFAIILGDATDKLVHEVTKEGKKQECVSHVMRDNVLFECGLCVMALGPNRVILLKEKSIRILEDLRDRVEEMGIKTLEYSNNDLEKLQEQLKEIDDYIEEKASDISPVVIGAAISTADGYFNNFILRFWENISKGFSDLNNPNEKFYPDISQIHMDIYIPNKISEKLKEEIINFYEINGYKKGIISQGAFRGVEFRYKMIGNELIICDCPSTLTASYDTVKDILNLSADESHDDHAEERFLMKERDSFLFTLKKLMTEESLSSKLKTFPYYQKNETQISRMLNLIKQVNIVEKEI